MWQVNEKRWQDMEKIDLALTQVMADYNADLKVQRKSPKTIIWYESNLKRFIKWLAKNGYRCVLSDLNLRVAKAYILHLEEVHRKYEDHPSTPEQDKRISLYSVQGHVRTLKALSSWLFREEYLPENVLARLRLPKAPKLDIKILTNEEIKTILTVIDPNISSGARNYATIILMLDSGLRMSEANTLGLSKVDLEHGRLWVNGKGSKERVVPIGNRSQRYLRRYIMHFRPEPISPDVDNVFLNLDGTPTTENSVRLCFKRLAKKCNIPRLHAHLCRHTFGTNYLRNGGDVFSLQKILGHEDLSTVKMYMHLADADVIEKHKLFSPMDRIDLPAPNKLYLPNRNR